MKYLEENIRQNFFDLGSGKAFLDRKPKAWSINEQVDKFTSSKLRTSVVGNKVGNEKRSHRLGVNTLITHLTKDLYPEYIKNSQNSVISRQTT